MVFDSPCHYDIILGSDFEKVGIDIRYSLGTLEWLGTSIPLRPAPEVGNKQRTFNEAVNDYLIQMEEEYFGNDYLNSYLSAPIKDDKYEKIDVDKLAKLQSHLTESQQKDLGDLFAKHKRLFMGN